MRARQRAAPAAAALGRQFAVPSARGIAVNVPVSG